MALGEPDETGSPRPRQPSVQSPWSLFIWSSSVSHAWPRVWHMSQASRWAQDGQVPGPCLLLSRQPIRVPDLGFVTFHDPSTLKQKRLLKGPLTMPQVFDQQLSVSSSQSRVLPKSLTGKKGHPTHQGPWNPMTPNPKTSTCFDKVNNILCLSALTAVFRKLSLNV